MYASSILYRQCYALPYWSLGHHGALPKQAEQDTGEVFVRRPLQDPTAACALKLKLA